jgi:hypothetical protein
MLKIYARKQVERKLLPILAEYRCKAVLNYPLKGITRKKRKGYEVVNFPIHD